jgi:hypothetical protein
MRTNSQLSEEKEKKHSSKLKERRGNVYENKGSAFKRRERSWNVIENKGSYASKAEMLLKTKEVDGRWGTKFVGLVSMIQLSLCRVDSLQLSSALTLTAAEDCLSIGRPSGGIRHTGEPQ